MNIVSFNLNNKKPLQLTTTSKQYILRGISYGGDQTIVVFLIIQGKKPMRICRMNGCGVTSYLIPIDKNVSFTLKGKGSVTLTFSEHEITQENDIPLSYMCDMITEDESKNML